jgi:non-lysosomal glucosylceramidase
MRKKYLFGSALLLVFISSYLFSEVPSQKLQTDIKKTFERQYLQLLIEKGLYDDQGLEIESRLSNAVQEAFRLGYKTQNSIVSFILGQLNHRPGNLAGFPPCAFDRPVGYKLDKFGHTNSPGTTDATAEGSACPVGGIGAGGFERTISGNFRYWFLKLGWMVDDTVWANQFHVFLKKGNKVLVQTLSTDSPPDPKTLSAWKWSYPSGQGSYYALFPKSGFSYEQNEAFPADLALVQFSPVIPGNYRETSFPVAVYRWIAKNPSRAPIEVSVLLTWENMVGWDAGPDLSGQQESSLWVKNSAYNFNEFVQDGPKKGIVFKKKNMDIKSGNALTGTMSIATLEIPGKTVVYYQTDFDPRGSGAEVWQKFANDGTLPNEKTVSEARKDRRTAGALAVKFALKPGERLQVPFVVSWDFPYYEFEKGVKYRKKYLEFFGETGENAFVIAKEALDRYRDWEAAIDRWQKEIVQDSRLPDWLKQALLNELYILVETSIWDASTNLHSYLESVDYLMYGTFDVDAYCWHLLKLWPELEKNNMRFFARTVDLVDPAYKTYRYPLVMPGEVPADKMPYYWNINKASGMIPHDIGSPRKRPWVILNAFDWQNGNVWKDLNPKFPLRGYRDFLYTGAKDIPFLKEMFRASVIALDTLEKRFSDPSSHIPLNEGIPDQTYDTWKMKGESAYVSILWLAALKAAGRMGQVLAESGISEVSGIDLKSTILKYRSWFESGRKALQKLWDEKKGYFHIDANTDDIMTDQLFGLWYSKIMKIEEDEKDRIIPFEQARRVLETIYQNNLLAFGGGLMGAVNGRTAEGKQLRSQQGDEVWAGTNYAFASNCILHGLVKEGMHAAYGSYYAVYSPFGQGYFFKTPEAYCNPDEQVWNKPEAKYGEKLFRAMKYMRPGAVWAVYEALTQQSR